MRWFRNLLLSPSAKNSPTKGRYRDLFEARLELRKLEPRRVLSVSANLNGDVLSIQLDAADDEVIVSIDDISGELVLTDQDGNTVDIFDGTSNVSSLDLGLFNRINVADVGSGGNQQVTFTDDLSLAGSDAGIGGDPVISILTDAVESVQFIGNYTLAGDLSIDASTVTDTVGADNGTLIVSGDTNIATDGGDVELDNTGNDFDTISVVTDVGLGAATGNITISDDNSIILDSMSALNLTVTAGDAITDAEFAEIVVEEDMSLTAGTSITLGDDATNLLTVGDEAVFDAGTSIEVGAATSDVNFGTVNFNGADVTIREDSSITVTGANTATNLSLTSVNGDIEDATDTTIDVTLAATFSAANGFIQLTDTVNDELTVGTDATFSAMGSIDIGLLGTANFGTLNFNGADVTIREDSSITVTGANTATNLSITSVNGNIEDATDTTIDVTLAATFSAANGFIQLTDTVNDELTVGTDATFSAMGSIDIGLLGTANFGTVNFNGADVTIREDSSITMTGTNTATNLTLTSVNGDIEDATDTTIDVTLAATFSAANGFIQLTDTVNDELTVGTDATFSAMGSIDIGLLGTANLGTLNFNGADVTIREDSSITVTGANTATNLSLTSVNGDIEDATDTTIDVTLAATFSATNGFIQLTDTVNDELTVGTDATFSAMGLINIGLLGTANFGTVNFNGANVTIREDSSITMTGANTATNLSITSVNGDIEDATDTTIDVTLAATFLAANGFIRLADTVNDELTVGTDAAFSAMGLIDIGLLGTANFGTVNFNGTNVAIREESSITVTGTNTATNLTLTSVNGDIEDATDTTIDVTLAATFSAANGFIRLADTVNDELTVGTDASFSAMGLIDIGLLGMANFGTVNFNGADVTIREDSSITMTGANTATNLSITSVNGDIEDATDTTIDVTLAATFLAANGFIRLADTVNDELTVGTDASFSAMGLIDIGLLGTANFGTVNFNGADVTIREDSSITMTGANTATNLSITSVNGDIEDATDTTIDVTLAATFLAANGFIRLADTVNDELTVGTDAAFSAMGLIDIGLLGTANFGTVNFNGTNVTIREESSITVTGANTATNLTLTSVNGDIEDATNTTIDVTLAATFLATNGFIRLADTVNDELTVGTDAVFSAMGLIDIGLLGTANFGTVNFNGTNVAIREESSITVTGANTATNLTLTSVNGDIEDATDTTIDVTLAATFLAANGFIRLADTVNDELTVGTDAVFSAMGLIDIGQVGTANFGTVNFDGTSVTIREDSSITVTGANTATNFTLTSVNGDIEDATDTTIDVTLAATFLATNGFIRLADTVNDELTVGTGAVFSALGLIDVGQVGTANFGTLNFNGADVTIREESSMTVAGANTAANLVLTSTTGSIFDADGTSINVDETAKFMAVMDITLADTANDVLNVVGSTFFGASTISVGVANPANPLVDSGATVNFGSVGLLGNTAVIHEDSNTHLDGVDLISLSLSTSATVTQSGVDALGMVGTGVVRVTADATFELRGDGGADQNFYLARVSNLPFRNDGILVDNEFDGTIDILGGGTLDDVHLRNISATAQFPGLDAGVPTTLRNLELWFTQSSIELPGDLVVSNDLTLIAGVDVVNRGTPDFVNRIDDPAAILEYTNPAASITDAAGVNINVGNDATLVAAGNITLGDDAADVWVVTGDVTLLAGSDTDNDGNIDLGGSIDVGAASTAIQFGTVNFNGTDVAIEEDDSMLIIGENSATSAGLTSVNGSIEDATGTTIDVTGDATFTSATFIELNEETGNVLRVDGKAAFAAAVGPIDVGGDGLAEFGQLNFNSPGVVTIQEDNDTVVAMSNTAGTLDLISAGSITDAAAATIAVMGDATFTAATFIALNEGAANTLTVAGTAAFAAPDSINVGAAGTALFGQLNFNSLGVVTIQEDNDTIVAISNTAGTLNLTSDRSITDTADATIAVTGEATIEAATSIALNEDAANSLTVGGKAAFAAPDSIDVGIDGTALFGELNFNSLGVVTIQEDDDTTVAMSNTAGTLNLNSAGSITDAGGASVNVTADATFTATTFITLNEGALNSLIIGGQAAFAGPQSIRVGSAGTAQFGQLNFNSLGAVTIQEDDDTAIAMSNTAGSLSLTSAGSIGDAADATINVTTNATFIAATTITLADEALNVLNVIGDARFETSGGNIDLGVVPVATPDDVTRGTDSLAEVNFGAVSFSTNPNGGEGHVTLVEDSSIELFGSGQIQSLYLETLASDGAITDRDGTNFVLNAGDTAADDFFGFAELHAVNGNIVLDATSSLQFQNIVHDSSSQDYLSLEAVNAWVTVDSDVNLLQSVDTPFVIDDTLYLDVTGNVVQIGGMITAANAGLDANAAILTSTDFDTFAANLSGFIDLSTVGALMGSDLMLRVNRVDGGDLNPQDPGNATTVDEYYALVLSNLGDMIVSQVVVDFGDTPLTVDGIVIDDGHAYLEAMERVGEAGNLTFQGWNSTNPNTLPDKVVDVRGGHVFTATAAGELTVVSPPRNFDYQLAFQFLLEVDAAGNLILDASGNPIPVLDANGNPIPLDPGAPIPPYLADYLGLYALLQSTHADGTIGTVTNVGAFFTFDDNGNAIPDPKLGPLLVVTMPLDGSASSTDPTSRTLYIFYVDPATGFPTLAQNVNLAAGSPFESNVQLVFEFADVGEQGPSIFVLTPGGIVPIEPDMQTNVSGMGVFTETQLQHIFNAFFVSGNGVQYPTDVTVYNDPLINLYQQDSALGLVQSSEPFIQDLNQTTQPIGGPPTTDGMFIAALAPIDQPVVTVVMAPVETVSIDLPPPPPVRLFTTSSAREVEFDDVRPFVIVEIARVEYGLVDEEFASWVDEENFKEVEEWDSDSPNFIQEEIVGRVKNNVRQSADAPDWVPGHYKAVAIDVYGQIQDEYNFDNSADEESESGESNLDIPVEDSDIPFKDSSIQHVPQHGVAMLGAEDRIAAWRAWTHREVGGELPQETAELLGVVSPAAVADWKIDRTTPQISQAHASRLNGLMLTSLAVAAAKRKSDPDSSGIQRVFASAQEEWLGCLDRWRR